MNSVLSPNLSLRAPPPPSLLACVAPPRRHEVLLPSDPGEDNALILGFIDLELRANSKDPRPLLSTKPPSGTISASSSSTKSSPRKGRHHRREPSLSCEEFKNQILPYLGCAAGTVQHKKSPNTEEEVHSVVPRHLVENPKPHHRRQNFFTAEQFEKQILHRAVFRGDKPSRHRRQMSLPADTMNAVMSKIINPDMSAADFAAIVSIIKPLSESCHF